MQGQLEDSTTIKLSEEGAVESKRRNQTLQEMGPPAAKRVCSTVASAVRRIAVEGNIAVGKSTFLRILEKASANYSVISEPLTRWQNVPDDDEVVTHSQQHGSNLLDLFYKDPTRWAYTFQSYACLSRLKAQLHALPPELLQRPNPVMFYERSVYSDKLVFATTCHENGLIGDTEWSIYCNWHSFLLDALPLRFDGIIYLRSTAQKCHQRLRKRNRAEEKAVSLDYLETLHDKHEQWLVHKTGRIPSQVADTPVLVLDCDDEFETNQENTKALLDKVAVFVSGRETDPRKESL